MRHGERSVPLCVLVQASILTSIDIADILSIDITSANVGPNCLCLLYLGAVCKWRSVTASPGPFEKWRLALSSHYVIYTSTTGRHIVAI